MFRAVALPVLLFLPCWRRAQQAQAPADIGIFKPLDPRSITNEPTKATKRSFWSWLLQRLVYKFLPSEWIGVSRPGTYKCQGDEIPRKLPPLWQGFAEEILNELEIQRMDFNHCDIAIMKAHGLSLEGGFDVWKCPSKHDILFWEDILKTCISVKQDFVWKYIFAHMTWQLISLL